MTRHWSLRAAPGKPPLAGPQTLNADNFLKDARGPGRRQHLRLPQRSPRHQPAAPAPASSHPPTAPCATGVPSLPNFLDARGSRAGNVSTESCGLIQQVRRSRQELLRTSQVPRSGPILTQSPLYRDPTGVGGDSCDHLGRCTTNPNHLLTSSSPVPCSLVGTAQQNQKGAVRPSRSVLQG